MRKQYMTGDQVADMAADFTIAFLEKWQDVRASKDMSTMEQFNEMERMSRKASEWSSIYLACVHMSETEYRPPRDSKERKGENDGE